MLGEVRHDVPADWYYHAGMPNYGLENCSDCVWEGMPVRWAGAQGISLTLSLPCLPLEMVMTGVRFDGGRHIQHMILTINGLPFRSHSPRPEAFAWALPFPVGDTWVKCAIHADGVAPDADAARVFCFSDISVRRRRG